MLAAAEAHYRAQQRGAVKAVLLARRSWGQVDPASLDASWRAQWPRLTAGVRELQHGAAGGADGFLDAVLAEQGIDSPVVATVNPAGFAGLAGDGRPLASLLYEPIVATKVAIGAGTDPVTALEAAGRRLDVMVATAVQDAGRGAVSAATAARPRVAGYVRMISPPSCDRCAVLAGKFYRWNTGFRRHPRCRCVHIPTSEDRAGDLRTNTLEAIKAGQVTGLSAADRKAILEDGADPSRVINARRGGVSTAQVYGRHLKTTTELAGRTVRPMPESIYKIAEDRADAVRLLRVYGYVL